MDSECLMVNCRNLAPDHEAMCAKHRFPQPSRNAAPDLIAKARRVEALEAALRVAARWFEQAAITHEIAAASCPPPENESYVLAARRDTFRANELRAALKENTDATSD